MPRVKYFRDQLVKRQRHLHKHRRYPRRCLRPHLGVSEIVLFVRLFLVSHSFAFRHQHCRTRWCVEASWHRFFSWRGPPFQSRYRYFCGFPANSVLTERVQWIIHRSLLILVTQLLRFIIAPNVGVVVVVVLSCHYVNDSQIILVSLCSI